MLGGGTADGFRATLDPNANETTTLPGRCLKREARHPGDTRTDGKPRLKINYEENAFRQLQAELGKSSLHLRTRPTVTLTD